ncbi:MAG TPA: hypothetical protein VGP24_05525 [Glaciihabitans sp.]|jgi:flagellar FliJ protein|nr:hypothetical protein [Glaciihabitans sp.]
MFPLLGLLRLRRLQEDTIAADLARANGRVRDNATIQERTRRALEGVTAEPTDVDTLRATASSRAASSSTLSALAALHEVHREAVLGYETEYAAAKSRTARLEKLETRHSSELAATDLRSEQSTLDEIATTAWQRSAMDGRDS